MRDLNVTIALVKFDYSYRVPSGLAESEARQVQVPASRTVKKI